MRTSSQLLLTFLVNAVWQIALIAALASFGAWLLRQSATHRQHWLWVAALCLSVAIPVATAFRTLPATSVAETSYTRELTSPVPVAPGEFTLERTPAQFLSSSFQLNTLGRRKAPLPTVRLG